jgi:hypothetical protein
MAWFRTVAAAAIFLFGTSFLWFMPSFLGTGAYVGAAWALYRARTWWRPLAIGGSVVGTMVLGLWWLAVNVLSGATNMAANLAMHAIGITVLLLVLLVPSLGRGFDRRLTGHPRHGT